MFTRTKMCLQTRVKCILYLILTQNQIRVLSYTSLLLCIYLIKQLSNKLNIGLTAMSYSNFWQESREFTVENNVYIGPVVNYTSVYKNVGHMIWDKLNSYRNKIAHVSPFLS